MKRTALLLAAILVLAGCSNAAPSTPAPGTPAPSTPAQYARALFEGVNIERAHSGLSQLTWSECLVDKALPRAQKTLTEEDLSHETLVATCTPDVAAGENLSRGQFTANEIVAKWMASAGHKANILRPGFSEAGVGCVNMPDAPQGFACSLLFEGGE